jgi:YggT family protein
MQDALTFIFRSLLDLYILTFVLRLTLQWVRADFRNPLSQFILRVTNPVVLPFRRLLPPVGGLDTATVVAALALQLIATVVLIKLACIGNPDILQLAGLAALRLVHLLLRIYFFAIIAYVIIGWVAPGTYNPMTSILAAMVEPVLAPLRRLIPPIAGLDLSPIFAILAVQALTMLLPTARLMSGLLCTSMGQLF